TDHDLPTHYSFQGEYGVRRFIARYEEVKKKGREAFLRPKESTPEHRAARAKALAPQVEAVIAAQDPQGRWVRNGRIECATFIRNLNTLSEYLELTRNAPAGK
ncbi:MAG TPA: hypothetical protein PLY56_11555, partial [Armatimonadota bacterium]|nr:hypothetical protein [Armatimonadota bacterium]